MKAIDFSGVNVLDLVKAKDDRFWMSNPFGLDPESKAQARDGLILEFTRPKGAEFVKLAFNVQNTLWAAYLQSQILKLQGRELEKWYALMNSSVEAREALKKAMIREGMLLIKLWDGETWKTSGFVWEVGPSVAKGQVAWLDIHDIPGEVLRIQLESTAGFWMVNSVQADYTTDNNIPLHITELSPTQAIDHLGRDLQETLGAIDDRYYAMPTTDDWAELTFKAPAQKTEFDRSFVLKGTGYYTIHVSAEGEPQRDLIAKLMTEPGAFGQYTLRLLNGYVSQAHSAMAKLEQKEK
jgi:hypothetical protein